MNDTRRSAEAHPPWTGIGVEPAAVRPGPRFPMDLAALAGFALIASLYVQRLTVWLIGDDEGSYLYAAWRMSRGEVPYRDFLTPQLPAFLLPGGWLMGQVGPDVWAARLLATAATLGAGVCVWYTARRLFGPAVALLAGAALLLHPDVFLFGRTFRADPFMLFYAALGVALFARAALPAHALDFDRAQSPKRWIMALAGVAFGLATLCKLFGPLPMAGCLAWLLVDGRRRQRSVRSIVADGAVLAVAAGLTVLAAVAYFYAQSPAFFEATVGHHLRQGAGLSPWQVLAKGMAFYLVYLRQNGNAVMVFVALAAGLMAVRLNDRRRLLLALQLPTVLVFLILSRESFERHLIYVLPALATLFAVAVWGLVQRERAIGIGIVLALLVPWWLLDVDHAWRWETGTQRLADFIQLTTAPADIVFSDYSELNFYAGRPTTYSAASLSAGAAQSGQITWRRIRDELAGTLPPFLVLDTDPSYAHLVFLRDRPDFLAWVKEHYGAPIGTFRRDNQRYELYAAGGKAPRRGQFAGGMALLAGGAKDQDILPGRAVDIRLAWQATAPLGEDLSATVRLVDDDGREWAAADGAVNASDPDAQLRVRPSSRWQAGEITTDRVTLRVPEGTPPGTYHLQVGVYASPVEGSAVWPSPSLDGAPPDDRLPHNANAPAARLRDVVSENGSILGQFIAAGELRVAPERMASDSLRRPRQLTGTADRVVGDSDTRMIGVDPLPTSTIQAGTLLTLWTWWYVRDDTLNRVCARLGAVEDGRVFADSFPRPANLPPAGDSSWQRGGIIVRWPLDLIAPADAPAGRYEALVGTAKDGSCVGPLDHDEDGLFHAGQVDVAARDLSGVKRSLPPLQRTLDAQVGQVGRLAGVNGSPESLLRGETMTLTLVWQAIAPSRVPLKATVQLLCPDGRPCAQDDREPADWRRPTTSWLPGEVILDPHPLAVPADLAPGTYPLVAGLYNAATSRRMAVTGRDSQGDLVRLGAVELR